MILVITNQKGGVGKTTTAVNLSACLASAGKRVLLVDTDPQGNATTGLGLDKRALEKSVYNVLVNGESFHDVIVPTATENLSIAPSNIDLAGAEVELVSMMARETILCRALKEVSEEYDFIIIDSPPSLGLLTLNALAASDQVVIPIQCEYYALEGLSQLMNTIKLVRKHLNPSLEIEGVVLTMFDSRTNLAVQVVDEVRSYFGSKVHKAIIPRNVRLGEAPSHGLPISEYDDKCSGADAYHRLAEEVIEQSAPCNE